LIIIVLLYYQWKRLFPPHLIFKFLFQLSRLLTYSYRHFFPRSLYIISLAIGFINTKCLYIACKLKIAEQLINGPLTIQVLAERTNVQSTQLNRVMRCLCELDIFTECSDGSFANNKSSLLLLADNHESLSYMCMHFGDETYNAFGELLSAVQYGEFAFQKANGLDTWDYYQKNTEKGENFANFMSKTDILDSKALFSDYDFSSFKVVTDIGGSTGSLLLLIIKKFPSIQKGILMDLPHVIELARKKWESEILELRNKIEFFPGDFFKAVPIADVYILRNILHDWNDISCVNILTVIRHTISNTGKLLIIALLLPSIGQIDPYAPIPRTISDVVMLANTHGKERTLEEYEELLKKSKFKLVNVIRPFAISVILEAVPI